MSEYTVDDFTESLARVSIEPAEISSVIAAWGVSMEGYGEWEGGFMLALRDGRFAYVWGWCDTTGWGCQDGATVEYHDERPPLVIKRGIPQHFMGYLEALGMPATAKWEQDWDEDPADLNLWLTTGATA